MSRRRMYRDLEQFLVREDEGVRMFFHCMENNYFHADDELATALVVVFQANRRDTYLRDCAIAYGTRCYKDDLSLVKEPNFCQAILSECVRLWSTGYLKHVLKPILRTLSSPACRIEIDKERFGEEDNLYENTFNLLAISQKLLQTIVSTTHLLPKNVRGTLTQLAIGMGSDDSKRCQLIITTFLFMRLICPALVLPNLYGLLPDRPDPALQRKLILLAMIVERIGTQNRSHKDEDYLKVTKHFIRESIEMVQIWASRLMGDPHLSRGERPYRRKRVLLNIRLGKGRRKNLQPYLLKICAFMLSNEDQIRSYFEQRARHARNPVKISQTYTRWSRLVEGLMHDDEQATKRRSARWVQLRNLMVAKMCTAESADVDEVDDAAKRRSVWPSTKVNQESDSDDDDVPESQYEDEGGSQQRNGKHKEPTHEEDNSISQSVCRRGRKKTKRTRHHRQPISA